MFKTGARVLPRTLFRTESRTRNASNTAAETSVPDAGLQQIRFVEFPTSPARSSPPVKKPFTPRRNSEPVQFTSEENKLFHAKPNKQPEDFDAIYLRDSCKCEACVDPHSGQRKFETADIPLDIRIKHAENVGDGQFRVQWENDFVLPGQAEGTEHVSTFEEAWLNQYTAASGRGAAFAYKSWSADDFAATFERLPYDEYMNSQDGFSKALDQLRESGLVILSGVPRDEKAVERIGERIGPLRDSFYGRTWDVRDVPKAQNVAYTSGFLGLHMDLLYMKDPPGLQLLHCLAASRHGGESIFADSFWAIKQICESKPDLPVLSELLKYPVRFSYDRGGHHFEDVKPQGGDKFGISSVNWSPPFQGDLARDQPATWLRGEASPPKLRNWLKSTKLFRDLVNSKQALWTHRLAEGECVVFNNRRVLHGRAAFSGVADGGEPRWLKGAYVDGDDFRSKLRAAGAPQLRLDKDDDGGKDYKWHGKYLRLY